MRIDKDDKDEVPYGIVRPASPAQEQITDGAPAAVARIYYRARCMECSEVDVILTALPSEGVGNSQVEAANQQLVAHRARTGHAIRTMEEQMAPRVIVIPATPPRRRLARRARAASFDASGEHHEEGV